MSAHQKHRQKPVYLDSSVSDAALRKKEILAVLGFGSQGHAHALNLRDSGHKVIVGLRPDSKSVKVARDFGFDVLSVAQAVAMADVIFVALPDMRQADVYNEEILPNLRPGKTLLFSHGLSIHFKLIVPPKSINVIMVAPKGPGHEVRRLFEEGKGVPSLVAVYQGGPEAMLLALAWAKGIGATRAGVLKTSFKEETETDLFGEQSTLCGGLSFMVKSAFEVLVEAGYSPEMAYFECLHEVKLISDLMNKSGISGMRFSISETAKYGDVKVGPKIMAGVKGRMRRALKDIQSGKFVRDWVREYKGGLKNYNRLLAADQNHQIEVTGRRLRSLMPWIPKTNIQGVQAAYSR